jgi:hypothetical protein
MYEERSTFLDQTILRACTSLTFGDGSHFPKPESSSPDVNARDTSHE